MRLEDDIKLDYSDVLIRPKRSTLSSRDNVELTRHFRKFPHANVEWTGVPIIASNMSTIGTLKVASVLGQHEMLTCIQKHITPDVFLAELGLVESLDFNYLMLSLGPGEDEANRILEIMKMFWQEGESPLIPFICLDVANGYYDQFTRSVESLRNRFESDDVIIAAGNVATAEMTEQLILSGADIVKVGIGPGSVCTTRKVTGVGYPQLSAVLECADAAHGLGGHIIADGGCVEPGDVVKAFGAGADFVMLGGMFSGHDETGEKFYGMSSTEAQAIFHDRIETYRASEGKSVNVEPRGPLSSIIQQILGGLRSACTYVGARELKHLPKCTTFVRVNRQRNMIFGDD